MRPGILLALVGGIVAGAGAAQAGDSPRVIIDKREQDTRRQAYQAKGYLLAGLRLDMSVQERLSVVDNVYAEARSGRRATFLSTTPSLRLATQGDRPIHLTAEASAVDVRAIGAAELGHTDGRVRLAGRAESRNRSFVTGAASWTRAHEMPGDPDRPGAAAGPTSRTEWQVSGNGLRRSGHWLVGTGGSLTRFDFDDVARRGGGTIDQDERDRWEMITTGRFGFAPTSAVDLFVEGREEKRLYDTVTSIFGIDRMSAGSGVMGGVAADLSGIMAAEVKVGQYEQSYLSPYFSAVEATVWDASMTWAITPLTTLRGQAVRRVEETAAEGYSGVLTDRWTLRAEHELLRNLILTVAGELGHRDYQGPAPDRADDLLTVTADAEWRLNSRWFVGLDAALEQRRSSLAIFDYDRLSLGLRAGARL